MPLRRLSEPLELPEEAKVMIGRLSEGCPESRSEGAVLSEAPNGPQSGLSGRDWLVYYEAWILRIDRALTKYGGSTLLGDTRGRAQTPTWLVEGLIHEEGIQWRKPSPPAN